jgi:hypothetical protein
MKLFKHADNDMFQLHELSEDNLVGLYNVCLNYKSYLAQIVQLPDESLLTMAPGTDAKIVRRNFKVQLDTCDEYIGIFERTIHAGNLKKMN